MVLGTPSLPQSLARSLWPSRHLHHLAVGLVTLKARRRSQSSSGALANPGLRYVFFDNQKKENNSRCFGKTRQITLLCVIPTMTFIHFVTGKSSGILSDIFSGIRSGILSGIPSGILPGISSGRCSGISSGICSGISSGIPSGILSGISSGILSGKSSGIPSGILSSISSGMLSGKSSGILSGKHSGTLSGISSGILSDILSGILSGIPSGILSGISSNILSGISSGTLCGISFGVDTRGWGPAGNTGRGWSWLRSGREHWAGMVVVEVRQGTLWIAGRSWTRRTRRTRRGRGGGGRQDAGDRTQEEDAGGNWHKI